MLILLGHFHTKRKAIAVKRQASGNTNVKMGKCFASDFRVLFCFLNYFIVTSTFCALHGALKRMGPLFCQDRVFMKEP